MRTSLCCGRSCVGGLLVVATAMLAMGCNQRGPGYIKLREEGRKLAFEGNYVAAREMLLQADARKPERLPNLNDLGAVSLGVARQRFVERNHAAAMRECDAAIGFYRRAIAVHPGYQKSLEGLNEALELKGEFEEALEVARWAAENLGPSAKHQVFLARELEQRGDFDAAMKAYRQALAMEPKNPLPHVAYAEFLLRRNNETEAIEHLKEAYRLNPKDRTVREDLIARGVLAASERER